MSTMLLYPQYFKRYGVILPGQVATPRLFPMSILQLPRNSMLHYLAESQAELGPPSDDLLLANVPRLVFVDHITELTSKNGNPRSAYIQPGPLIQEYRRRYRKLRQLNKLELADREPQNLLVMNYALLPRLYKYIRSFFSQYYTWYNIQATMWDTVNKHCRDTKRAHFITLNLPTAMPAVTELRKAEARQTRETLEAFNSPEALGLLDLWMWLGENRATSLIGRVDKEDLGRVNIIFRHVGSWFMVNLGVLDKWRKDPEQKNDTGVESATFQLRFLKMLSKLHETGSLAGGDSPIKEIVQIPLAEANAPTVVEEEHHEEATDAEVAEQIQQLDTPMHQDEIDDLDVLIDSGQQEDDGTEFDEDGVIIQKDPVAEKALNLPSAVSLKAPTFRTLESTIIAKVEELVPGGHLTAAEYRTKLKQAVAYQSMKDPYGRSGSLAEAMVLKREDLVLKETPSFPDSAVIIDKSMLKSSVSDIDRQYITNVLPKNIMSMVMSVQHAGVAVTGYEIEHVKDAVSDYEIHAVTLSPVIGRQSTIRFRVPRVDPNGTYTSNGTKYRLRKQRSDLPFVKVSPTRVALSSYYAKLFVDKSDRKTFNYDQWMGNQIVAKGLDQEDTSITDIRISFVSNDSNKVPRIYSVIATRAVSFNSKGDFYWFDYDERFNHGPFNDADKVWEKGNLVLVGKRGNKPILVDENDVFYLAKGDDLTVLGRAEDLFDIPYDRAPAPMAELRIFSKVIPVGVVLAYLVGFSNLLKLLGANPRRVANGQRMNLMPDEYAIRFLDESLIFSKDDVKTSLVMAGFNQYHGTIRNYTVSAFDKKDIYLNLLENYGIGVRYLREMDLMNAMFIDPITKELLEWMKEPTELIPLLIRACEVLVTRYVPEKVEGADGFVEGRERARGYERFAGAVYSELVRSIRVYNARTATSSASISMNPHDVWTTIVQDPASEPVNEANPIHNLKEKEVITFGGRGGRSRRSMVAESRLFKKSDEGFISEATVDSGDVAIITYLPPNACFTSVYGTVRNLDAANDGSTARLSTAALLAPQADRDDPKRVNISPFAFYDASKTSLKRGTLTTELL